MTVCVLQELVISCGAVQFRPFDQLYIQVSVDSSDVQHQRVVCKLIEPHIPGFSVPAAKPQDANASPEKRINLMKK